MIQEIQRKTEWEQKDEEQYSPLIAPKSYNRAKNPP